MIQNGYGVRDWHEGKRKGPIQSAAALVREWGGLLDDLKVFQPVGHRLPGNVKGVGHLSIECVVLVEMFLFCVKIDIFPKMKIYNLQNGKYLKG